MKKMIGILLAGTMMIGLLSGCVIKPISTEGKQAKLIKTAYEKMYEMLDADALHRGQQIDMSLSGRELDIQVDRKVELHYCGMGTDDLLFHSKTTGTTTINEEDPHELEVLVHYADGTAYIDTPYVDKKKQALTAEAFLDYVGFESADEEKGKIATDILEDGKLDQKQVEIEIKTDNDQQTVLSVKETAQLMLPLLLEVSSLPTDTTTVEQYECRETYTFDKDMVLLRAEAAITGELAAFGESYVVELSMKDTFDTVTKEDVPTLFGQKNYREQDLVYLDMFNRSYEALVPFKTATIAESESFKMSSNLPDNYSYHATMTATQTVSEDDVLLDQKAEIIYNVRVAGQKNKKTDYSYARKVKGGIATTVEEGEVVDKADWVNPLLFYVTGAVSYRSFDKPEDDAIKTIKFTEKDGKLTCQYTFTSAALDDVVYGGMATILGEESAEVLIHYVKNGDYTKNSGTLVLDTETGAVISHKVSVKAVSDILGVPYPIEFSYSMTVSDTTVAAPPTVGDEVAV